MNDHIDLKKIGFTKNKYMKILPFIETNDKLTTIKDKLDQSGIDVSYNEIKLSIVLSKKNNIDVFF